MEHAHCFCIPCSYTTETVVAAIKRRDVETVSDAYCCHCGLMQMERLKMVFEGGHGVLRHLILRKK